MLATLAEPPLTGASLAYEPKYDGIRALVHVASGARLAWANGLTSESGCQKGIDSAVDLLFRGIGRSPDA